MRETRSRLGLLETVAEEVAAAGRIAEAGESQVMLEEVGKIALGIVSVDREFQLRAKQHTRWGICWVTRRCCDPSN